MDSRLPVGGARLICECAFGDTASQLECFLAMRLSEMQLEGDALSASVLQEAPAEVQLHTRESVGALLDVVRSSLAQMTAVRMQHLYQLHSSAK